jgi:uncharacterized protein (TIGR03118 family)
MLNSRRKYLWLPVAIAAMLAGAVPSEAQHYTRTDLTQDAPGVSATAVKTDPNLVNPWGLSRTSGSPWWVSDNGTGLSTLYDGTGAPQSLVVTIPPPAGSNGTAAPTGTVYNYTTAFNVAPGTPAIFLFVTEDGSISGWNPSVSLTNAVRVVDRSKVAEYKGLALAMTNGGPRLYATNFISGKIEVFDGSFHRVALPGTPFTDSRLPADFVPFNIQNVGGNLVVTFVHRAPGSRDEDHGAGMGYVSIFDKTGHLMQRLAHGSFLNAPWGVAEAPADFGAFSHRLLIGNFGDGTLAAFDPISGNFQGKFLNHGGSPIRIDGLWALGFGNGATAGNSTSLYFTAGPKDENHGLFGKITAVDTEQRGNTE